MTSVEKLQDFEKRIEVLKQHRTAKSTELKILQEQYNVQVEELKNLGITDLQNLPQTIAQLDADIQQKEQELETKIQNLEQIIK